MCDKFCECEVCPEWESCSTEDPKYIAWFEENKYIDDEQWW